MVLTMVNPAPGGGGGGSPWWVVSAPSPAGRASALVPPSMKAVQGNAKPPNTVAGPFISRAKANDWINSNTPHANINIPNPLNTITSYASSWLSGLGGQIGSGIESAFVSGLTDLWDVITGPLEIIFGGLLLVVALFLFFKDDIMNIGHLLGASLTAVM